MILRDSLVEKLLKIKTYVAVDTAHTHLMDMHRLRRSDNLGTRILVPALKLGLGRDQGCLNYCMWWATTGNDAH